MQPPKGKKSKKKLEEELRRKEEEDRLAEEGRNTSDMGCKPNRVYCSIWIS